MGVHRKKAVAQESIDLSIPLNLPPFPNNKGKIRKIKAIDGEIVQFAIEDEISRLQTTNKQKIIVFQKIRFIADSSIEYRFGYYMIGFKPKARGRWVWGQFCLLIPEEDLVVLMQEANKRKWFQPAAALDRSPLGCSV